MSSTQTDEGRLLAEFPPVSYEDWRKLVEAELKGAPFDKKMFTATYEGITLKPIYRREDTATLPHVNSFPGFAPFVRGAKTSGYLKEPWDISQELTCSSSSEFNHIARNYTTRGLTALNMVFDKATRNGLDPDWAKPEEVGFFGPTNFGVEDSKKESITSERAALSISSMEDLNKALEGIDFEKTKLFMRCGASGLPLAAVLAALVRKRKKTTTSLQGCIETDPLGILAHEGQLPQSMKCAYREMAALTRWASEHAPRLQTICVHSRSWNEAGGSAVQELAFSLAMAVDYLRQMNKHDLPVDVVAPRIRFAVTVGVDFFMEIAKLRALRMLWARVVAAAGGNEKSQKLSLHVRTSRWNKTVYDPYNNMLRTTVEAFAGVLGGCDSMQVGAFDIVFHQPDDFSQRIARNTQLVLQKECNLDCVIDPAGGSWYIEVLTAEIASRAWALFQEIEKTGGMEAAMRAGIPQKAIAAAAVEKFKAVNRRKDSVVGVNQYANTKEKPLERPPVDVEKFHKYRVQQISSYRMSLEDDESADVLKKLENIVNFKGAEQFEACVDAVQAGATIGEITRAIRIKESPCEPITPVILTRRSIPFERLRAAMDRFVVKTGNRPAVFLCAMGGLKDYKARADFSRGFFSPGGYDAVVSKTHTPEEVIGEFAASDSKIAVICSTDDNYPALVPALAKGIRAAKPDAIIVLAGYPQDQIETHKQSGVNEFIHIRADVCETLKQFHTKLGIE